MDYRTRDVPRSRLSGSIKPDIVFYLGIVNKGNKKVADLKPPNPKKETNSKMCSDVRRHKRLSVII